MLRMRLRRTGKTKQPTYRVVVADQRAKRDGDFVEVLGHYNPRTRPSVLEIKEDRVRHWLAQGVQPSETVHRLLFARGLTTIEPPKRVTKPSNADVATAKAATDAEAAAKAEAAARVAAEAKAAEEATAAAAAAEAARAAVAAESEIQTAGAAAEFTES